MSNYSILEINCVIIFSTAVSEITSIFRFQMKLMFSCLFSYFYSSCGNFTADKKKQYLVFEITRPSACIYRIVAIYSLTKQIWPRCPITVLKVTVCPPLLTGLLSPAIWSDGWQPNHILTILYIYDYVICVCVWYVYMCVYCIYIILSDYWYCCICIILVIVVFWRAYANSLVTKTVICCL